MFRVLLTPVAVCIGLHMIGTWKFRFPKSKWQEIRLGAFAILVNLCLLMQERVNLCLLMQGSKLLTFSMLDWGCQIFHGTRECQKELFIKSSDTIQSTRRLNHFLVEVTKIVVSGQTAYELTKPKTSEDFCGSP